MNVIIYESASFGGCYEYAVQLFANYSRHREVNYCNLVLPVKSSYNEPGVKQILISDQPIENKLLGKLSFLYRIFINPLILFFFAIRQRPSLLMLNDFEQLTVPIWVPLFYILKIKHQIAVILHDPDRDQYPPSYMYSVWCMKRIIKLVDFALYHDHLPEKPYYPVGSTQYLSVPHGIYPASKPNVKLLQDLQQQKSGYELTMGIIGNIRPEKNYQLVIEALSELPEVQLVIAGSPANSSVDTDQYKKLARELNVDAQIIWLEKYLSETELSSVITAVDLILLYYASTFTSQSGILNTIAPYEKRVIIADTHSGLAKIARENGIGKLVEPDNKDSLLAAIKDHIQNNKNENWTLYMRKASWKKQIDLTIDNL